jgi:ATP-binding cassette, subfamily B, bacterial PglK
MIINLSPLKKLWSMFTLEQRRVSIVLVIFMLIGMALEILGISLIIPALSMIMQHDIATQYPILIPWLERFGNPSHEKIVIAEMLFFVCVFIIKTLFLTFLAWKTAQFLYSFLPSLSQRLFIGYMQKPYAFHLQRNSAQLIRNTINQVNIITSVTQQGLLLLAEVLVLIGISALLLYVETFGAILVMSILMIAGIGFHNMTKDYLLRWGEARQYHDGMRIQHVQQGLGGVKDIKLLGRESGFTEQYRLHNFACAQVSQRQATLLALPRLWLELLAIIGLVVLVLAMIFQGKPIESLIPTLGVFAGAALRLMPSVNRIITAVQSIRYSMPVIDTLHNELKLFHSDAVLKNEQDLKFKYNLKLEKLDFRYPESESKALENINITIPCGASVGLIGGSGAGKSTLVDIILGLFIPETGSVNIDGINIRHDIRSWQDKIGYVPQSIYLTDDSLLRNVAFGVPDAEIDHDAVWCSIKAAQLEQFVNELSKGIDTVVGERGVRLSGGQRQRIGVARALYHDPSILVLDEATSSLDVETEREVMRAVDNFKGKKTIIIVAHRLSTVENCDYIYKLERGKVIEEGKASVVLDNIVNVNTVMM